MARWLVDIKSLGSWPTGHISMPGEVGPCIQSASVVAHFWNSDEHNCLRIHATAVVPDESSYDPYEQKCLLVYRNESQRI